MPFCSCEAWTSGRRRAAAGTRPRRSTVFASGAPADLSHIGCPCGGGCPRCAVSLADGKQSPEKGKSRQGECGKKCGGVELGSTECEISLTTGLPTGKVTEQINEKDPCRRRCVVVHEDVHAKEIAPICQAVRKCLDAAGAAIEKQNQCLDTYEANTYKRVAGPQGTECKAYTAEEKCLNGQAKSKECLGKDADARRQADLARLKCYKNCYCQE